MKHTLTYWLDYIAALHSREIDLGLERVAALAHRLSLTTFSCPVVTVAGTNGKGSIIKFLESIYLASGYRVGAYTSPHLMVFNERFRVNGENVSDEELIRAFEFIEVARNGEKLSFFEFSTLVVLYLCREITLDVLLLEVGLGGRLDAVNVVDPDVAVISNIDLDHTDWLGPDRESIGKEKAGIMRPHIPVICGDEDPPDCLAAIAKKNHAPFFRFKRDFKVKRNSSTWDWEGLEKTYVKLPYPTLKLQNAATSIMVIEQLQSQLPVTQYGIITGIKNAVLPGRFECMDLDTSSMQVAHGAKKIICDVAHNPQATAYLAEQLRRLPPDGRTLAVVGMLKDKDIAGSLVNLILLVDAWYVGGLPVARGASAHEISSPLSTQGAKNCYNFASVVDALKRAIADSGERDRLLVFGSFYTVGMAKEYLSMIEG